MTLSKYIKATALDSSPSGLLALTHPSLPLLFLSSSLLCEQKTRYETYISLLQAKLRAETDDLEKIEASVMGGLIMEGGLAGRECLLRKTQSSPSISQAQSGLNGRAAGQRC